MTVQPARDGGWVAIIQEKLEMERTGPDGQPQKMCSMWITKDGWRQKDGVWQITFSEAVGMEMWRATPPLEDWAKS